MSEPMEGFPIFSSAARQGEAGVHLVARIVFDTFGWIFRRNHQEHDFGIDGYLEVVSDGHVTGKLLAVQIKHGASFFNEVNRWGYVYRGDLKHFNYLVNHSVPVIIVISNPDSKVCHWVRFDPQRVQLTQSAWTITVPFANKLHEAKKELTELAGPPVDALSEVRAGATLNKLILDSGYIMFVMDKEEINGKDTSRATDFFKRLLSTREFAFENQGKVELSFYGYDDDPRELFEIPEVREFVALLDAQLDSLFFFVRTGEGAYTLKLFVFCLCDAEWEGPRATPGKRGKVVFDTHLLGDFLYRHFLGLNSITEWLGMSVEENKKISLAVMECIGIDTSEFEK